MLSNARQLDSQNAQPVAVLETLRGPRRVWADDVFIAGYPKSGNTWMRFLIANMMAPEKEITFRNLNEFVPAIHHPAFQDNYPRPRVIKTHWPAFDVFPRMIYIFRDARDVMVSHYHYAVKKGQFKGPFSKFLKKNYRHKHYGSWHEHVNSALDRAERDPQNVVILQYEKMLQNPVEGATRMAQLCGFDLSPTEISAAVERCEFSRLQKNEAKHGSLDSVLGKNSGFQFFRAGRAGQYDTLFSQRDMSEFLEVVGPTLQRLGYLDSSGNEIATP